MTELKTALHHLFGTSQVGKLFNIPILIGSDLKILTWLLIIMGDFSTLLLLFVPLFASVLLHEFGHILMARKYKIDCANVRLHIIGGIANLKIEKSFVAKEEFWITLMGPSVNLIIFAVAIPFYFMHIPHTETLIKNILFLNANLFLFNLIVCVYPMDGGRILRSSLAMWFKNELKASKYAFYFNCVATPIYMILGIYFGYYLVAIILPIIFFFGWAEYKSRLSQSQNQKVFVKSVKIIEPPITKKSWLNQPYRTQ